jgi:integrase
MVRPEFRMPRGAFAKPDATRVKWLRPEEELIVFDTVQQATKPTKKVGSRALPFAAMARLAALTLMRLTEIRTLRREQLHLEQGVLMLPRTKTEPRPVILSGEAQEILRGQLEQHTSEWVFPSPDNRPYSRVHVSRVWRRAARAAGLKDFHFHDLRHHGATMALNKGFTAPVVMALGGWKSEAMMRRYAAVTDKTLRAAAEAVSGAERLDKEFSNGNR